MSLATPLIEIIIGEDNPADSRLISLCLEPFEEQIEITCFPSGRKLKDFLINRAPTKNPTFLFLDFFLAEIEGPRLLKWIREESVHRDMPVIMMSGSYLDEVREKSYEFGGNYFLEKSTDPERFFREIRGILGFFFNHQRITA